MKDISVFLSANIRNRRKELHLTQLQLAEKLRYSEKAISKWESGKGYPNIDSLKCIAKEFDVSIDELLSGDEWVALAETESKRKVRYFHNIAYAVMDMLALSFIFLPVSRSILIASFLGVTIISINISSFYPYVRVIKTIYQ